MPHSVRIIGLDPGLQRTGYGIIDATGSYLKYVAHGVATSDASLPLATRLYSLYHQLSCVIENFSPDEAAVEETFVNMNPTSTLRLGMARGVVMMVPAKYAISTSEYAANRVKKSVVGVGHAHKDQVAMMVQRLLPGCGKVTSDGADALAIAICHAHFRTMDTLLKMC